VISFAWSKPFRMCLSGGSPSGMLQHDRRSSWFVRCSQSVAGCVLVCIWFELTAGGDS
jgi:hypothetical protein